MMRDLILRNNVMIAQGGVDWQADTAQLLGNVPDRVQGLFFGKYVFICMREVVSIGINVSDNFIKIEKLPCPNQKFDVVMKNRKVSHEVNGRLW